MQANQFFACYFRFIRSIGYMQELQYTVDNEFCLTEELVIVIIKKNIVLNL